MGNLYIADYAFFIVRKVTADGMIHTVAGNGPTSTASDGDGGPATSAFMAPNAVAVDGAGNLYISITRPQPDSKGHERDNYNGRGERLKQLL